MFRVVIADDEKIIRMGLKRLSWEEHGMCVVAEAKNGIEATEIINSMEFDVLLTDIKMPGCTGLELAKLLHNTNPKSKTILLSGYGEFEYAQQAISNGVFDYILKPSMPDDILMTVRAACDEVKKQQEQEEKIHELEGKLTDYQSIVATKTVASIEEGTDIKKIVTFIYKHYMEALTLAVLAEHFHFNTVYLSAYIKKKTGHTFLEILTSIRMYHATKLLSETSYKNGEIGMLVGVPDERYFGQVFKKTYGITPYEYKKQKTNYRMPLENLICENKKDLF